MRTSNDTEYIYSSTTWIFLFFTSSLHFGGEKLIYTWVSDFADCILSEQNQLRFIYFISSWIKTKQKSQIWIIRKMLNIGTNRPIKRLQINPSTDNCLAPMRLICSAFNIRTIWTIHAHKLYLNTTASLVGLTFVYFLQHSGYQQEIWPRGEF